jgi:dolichol kinase
MARELRRKSIHLLGLGIPIIYYFIHKPTALVFVGSLVFIALFVEVSKTLFPSFRSLFLRFFSPMLRSHERRGKITGATYYLIGSFLCILFFSKNIALVCLCFLILGDLFAAVVGKQWGRTKLLNKKSLEGSVACFVVCALVAVALMKYMKYDPIIALTGALTATLVELFPTGIDDNITMPLASGLVMQLILNSWY